MARPLIIPLLLTMTLSAAVAEAVAKVPILYSTDLHHPHMDPDDHYDLATLFALPELDVRGIVLDCGAHQRKAPGSVPVKQMLKMTGREVPFAVGLGRALQSPDDEGRNQPADLQGGVALILDVLRRSAEPVTVFTTGSLRDVAAALNREPELLRRKIGRLYINAGNPGAGADSRKWEYNVKLDRNAYCCVMRSGLPIYWCPCFDGSIWQRGQYGTYWKFQQAQVLETAPRQLQNWFLYALTKPKGVDSIEFLTRPQDPHARAEVWKATRNMWCTAPFFHAAGRRIYRRGNGDYVALQQIAAKQQGLADAEVDVIRFVPVRLGAECSDDGAVHVQMERKSNEPNGFVFESASSDYNTIMTDCLKNLLMKPEEPR